MFIFRRITSFHKNFGGGRKSYVPTYSSGITVGTAAGAATVVGAGVAIKSAIGLTDGSASVNGIGVAIKAFAGTAAGTVAVSGTSTAINLAVGAAAGSGAASGIYDSRAITSTRVLQKPVDYALAGQQINKARLGGRALQHAFGE